MESLPNYYQLLHVQPDAPEPVIKASYRAMMQKMRLHPDLGGDESVAKSLNEAVSTLCNPDARAAYDLELAQSQRHAPGGEPAWDRHTSSGEDDARGQPESDENERADSRSSRKNPGTTTEPSKASNHSILPARERCPFCHAAYPTFRVAGFGYANSGRCAQCKAAATPIEQFNSESEDDVRKIYRHDHQTQATLWTEWPVSTLVNATMTDMSIAGCAVECVNPLAVQSIIVLDTQLLNGICIVRYCKRPTESGSFAIGMEFLTLDITSGSGAVFSATA